MRVAMSDTPVFEILGISGLSEGWLWDSKMRSEVGIGMVEFGAERVVGGILMVGR